MIKGFDDLGHSRITARKALTVAMAGCPNSGKSALFNSLTGSHQKVGNYPGVTIERKIGRMRSIGQTHLEIDLIDLPGIYSLHPSSMDESISVRVLKNISDPSIDKVDAIMVILDATHFERGVAFLLEILTLKTPIIAVVNMIDLAEKRKLKIDIKALSKELGIPVFECIATSRSSTSELAKGLKDFALKLNESEKKPTPKAPPPSKDSINAVLERKQKAKQLAEKVTCHPISPSLWTKQLDRVLLSPVSGIPILAAVLILMFQAVFNWAQTPMDLIEEGVTQFSAIVASLIPESDFSSLLTDGIIAGVGSVLVFLPQILILFFFINLLESTGYMMRAAFLMNRLMSYAGLQGQSFVPLLSSFACAIPGMMAARTVKNPYERLVTIFISPLMTCSARLPVYVLIISAFIPNSKVFGILNLQGLVMFSLFLLGVVSAFLTAYLMKRRFLKARNSPFLIELPSYKWPSFRQILVNLWMRAKIFLKKAGGYILLVSIALWILSSFPKAPEGQSQLSYSIAGRIGAFIEPILRPVGFDARIAIALVPGFAAREVLVSSLGTVFAVEDKQSQKGENERSTEDFLTEKLPVYYSLATALALLAWYIYAPQCLATFAVMRRETNSWKWPVLAFIYLLALAYLAAFVTYTVTTWLQNS